MSSTLSFKFKDPDFIFFRLEKLLRDTVFQLFPDIDSSLVTIEYPKDPAHGDYASNIALKLSKKLHQNPRQVAEQIQENLSPVDYLKSITVEEPGFLNFTLNKNWLAAQIQKIIAQDETFGQSSVGGGQVAVVDLSAPNIAKPMNVGHLRSTIIGDSIVNIYNKLGFRAIGDNHLGDWGTQFGKLIAAYKKWGDREAIAENPIPELLSLYVKFHDEAKKDPDLEESGRQEFSKLEKGDPENRALWQLFKDVSLKEFNKIYEKLNIKIAETLGESFYEDKMQIIIDTLLKAKIAEKNDDGSIAIVFEKHGINLPSCLLVKKDGGTLYHTRDLATLKYRIDHFKAKKAIYAVGSEQKLYFQQLFAIAKLLKWDIDCVHVDFGLVRLKEGKLSTREGRVIYLEDLIAEAENRTAKILTEKGVHFPEAEQKALIKTLSIGAIKYNDLSQNRTTEILFDWDKMLSFEGNSCPYLQYTFARARSILRKAGENLTFDQEKIALTEKKEINVARLLVKYPEYILSSAESFRPNLVANYLFELTKEFNVFYNSLPVLEAPDEITKTSRLSLVKATTIVIQNGLKLLGIKVPERM